MPVVKAGKSDGTGTQEEMCVTPKINKKGLKEEGNEANHLSMRTKFGIVYLPCYLEAGSIAYGPSSSLHCSMCHQ